MSERQNLEAQRLIDAGNDILHKLDEFNAEQERDRTWGSMALSSYRSDEYARAMRKIREGLDLLHGRQ